MLHTFDHPHAPGGTAVAASDLEADAAPAVDSDLPDNEVVEEDGWTPTLTRSVPLRKEGVPAREIGRSIGGAVERVGSELLCVISSMKARTSAGSPSLLACPCEGGVWR